MSLTMDRVRPGLGTASIRLLSISNPSLRTNRVIKGASGAADTENVKPPDTDISMKSRFRVYLVIISLGSLALFVAGVYLQVRGVRELMTHASSAGFVELCFGILVAITGCSLLLFGWRHTRREALLAARKDQYPEATWKWRQEWADGHYVASTLHPRAIVVTAGVVCLVALVAGYKTFVRGGLDLASNEIVLAMVSLLCLVLVAIAIAVSRRWSSFGECRFLVSRSPIPIGGQLSGILVTDISPEFLEDCSAEAILVCKRIFRQNRRHSRSARETVVSRSVVLLKSSLGIRQSDEGHVIFPVEFAIPEGSPESTAEYSGDVVEWKLAITLGVHHSTHKASFVLPVFESETDEAGEDHPVVDVDHEKIGSPLNAAIRGVFVHRRQGTTSIYVEPTKRVTFAAATIGFGIVWAAVVGYLALEEAPRLLTVLAATFICVPVYGALCIWFERTRIIVNNRGLVIHRQLGPIRYSRSIPYDDVGQLLLSSFASVGSTNYFDLILLTKHGRRLLVVGRLAGQSSAEWIGFQINAALGRCSRVVFSGTVIGHQDGDRTRVAPLERTVSRKQAIQGQISGIGRIAS